MKNNLLNRKNKTQLLEKLNSEVFDRKICSFYRYIKINDVKSMRKELFTEFSRWEILGRIYIAPEGINAQISVPTNNWDNFINTLNSFIEFKNIFINFAIEDDHNSFIKLIVRSKEKIVADGLDDNELDLSNVGKSLSALEFNTAMEHPNSIVVDMRNYYESEVGHFNNAICPDADTFKNILPLVKEMLKGKENNKLLLYCTGGIRCEKASAFLKHNDFKDVNQLKGGIISYIQQINKKNLENKFKGKNFVFDARIGENITEDIISKCHQCESPSNRHTNCNNQACHILFIQCEKCNLNLNGCCSKECSIIASKSIEEQKKLRKFPAKAAPLRQYQKGTKPRLKDLIKSSKNAISA